MYQEKKLKAQYRAEEYRKSPAEMKATAAIQLEQQRQQTIKMQLEQAQAANQQPLQPLPCNIRLHDMHI